MPDGRAKPAPDWFSKVQAGDVLRTPSGDLRLVRAVHRNPPKPRRKREQVWVYFAIRHCSWTGRCYTLYSDSDSYLRQFEWVTRRKNWRPTRIDREIAKNIADHRYRTVGCAKVRGLP